jgi:hypothetical protein
VTFSYYRRLSPRDQRTYRRSDQVTALPLPAGPALEPCVRELELALARDQRPRVEKLATRLCAGITRSLAVPGVRVTVRAVRPHADDGELHGLYTLDESGRARIEIWMRTARERRVVAFRTFLRTLLHELCHHLDLTLLELPETFHTEGFFKRESSLFRQLLPARAGRASRGRSAKGRASAPRAPKSERAPAKQLSLFE